MGEIVRQDAPPRCGTAQVRLEAALAALEGAERGAVFATGLAAENAVLQALLRPGDEIVVPADAHGGTRRLLRQIYAPQGVVVKPADLGDLSAVDAALTPRTRLLWVESPTNPLLRIRDIAALAEVAHACGVLVVVDNSLATPACQQPLHLGADLVVHGAARQFADFPEVSLGAVLARDAEAFKPVKALQNAVGGTPGPVDCWLALQGIRTIELRVRRQSENAAAVANALAGHRAVRRVAYPGLADHPGHALAARQMAGFGGLLAIELDATVDEVREFVSSRRLFSQSEQVGGVWSAICHPATTTHRDIPLHERARLGLSDTLVRLSPGIEDAADLIEDLEAGLACIRGGATSRTASDLREMLALAPAAM